ncbi:Hypothetical protein NTJ_08071 [Nesidiocoris tenuis]|uniref:Uncharacterized protein n=1 Tax=Nesidiocoris tenuis TaxID=355587 RepID=A0ABN7ASU9_9HEMI|nr:Hypothetical protein NTJ_08071 [Nesidiocoris tenuis]
MFSTAIRPIEIIVKALISPDTRENARVENRNCRVESVTKADCRVTASAAESARRRNVCHGSSGSPRKHVTVPCIIDGIII